jgi:hypothetical protein
MTFHKIPERNQKNDVPVANIKILTSLKSISIYIELILSYYNLLQNRLLHPYLPAAGGFCLFFAPQPRRFGTMQLKKAFIWAQNPVPIAIGIA